MPRPAFLQQLTTLTLLLVVSPLAVLHADPAIARPAQITNPVITQRADTAIIKHTDGFYYMTASVPDYKRVELRRATTLQGLGTASTVTAFTAPSSGALSGYLWAPDIRFYDGAWYLYFSGAPGTARFDQRIYWMRTTSADPTQGTWTAPARLTTNWDSFSLDPASFEHNGSRYLVWAQKEPGIATNSNLYISRMNGATAISGQQVRIAVPTLAWEKEGYAVNEGPQIVTKNGKIFIAYSAAATDARYKLGLLTASGTANLLDPASWSKTPNPVFTTANGVYGPGHGSFTVAEDGTTDILVYHARDYDPPAPDALTDPNRHTRMQQLLWKDDGSPFFGQPSPNGATRTRIQGSSSGKCLDNYDYDTTPGAPVKLYDCNGNTVQQFDFDYLGTSHYRIVNRNTGTCLEDKNGSTTSNTEVVLNPCDGSAAQRWGIRDRANGWFQLYNVGGGMCLDNYNHDSANGARISLYACNTSTAQMWRRA
ncbi:MAG: hypothetical protein QG671_3601 [Actinomycetota bacterium]|nr:hypothetical protein [Actinomycetota bacterium]